MNRLVLAAILAATLPATALAQQSNPSPQKPDNHPTLNRQTQSPAANPQQSNSAPSQAANADKSEIQQAQQALDEKGMNAGKADGIMGPRTRQAVRVFQLRQKLRPSGRLDNQTLAALGVSQQPQSGSGGGQNSTVGQSPGNKTQGSGNQNQGQQH